jgi:site-specific recombinase XerD
LILFVCRHLYLRFDLHKLDVKTRKKSEQMKKTRTHSFSVLFWGQKTRKNKRNEFPIYVRITVNGKRAELSTHRFVAEGDWDAKSQRVKPRANNAVQINSYLDMMRGRIQEIFNALIVSDDNNLTASKIKEVLIGAEIKPKVLHKTIMQAFEYHNLKILEEVVIGKVVKKTHERYIITKNKVQNFMKHQYKVDDMPLPEMRLRFVTEFEHYLLTKEKLQSNTAHKYIKNLKKIMNMSVGLDWIPSNPFNNFRCSYASPEREVLTQQELNLIMNKHLDIPRLEEVRDVFIFCCYTGFAYSDVYKFERHALALGIDGEYWLSTNRQKTGTRESVPLLPIALEIIQKYRDHEYCIEHNKLLPVNSNQRFNSYLKELADICGIKKKITTHIARHTFATTVTLANGVPIETVSSMLGHNSIRTTQIYAKVVEKKVSEDMQLLKEKLFGAIQAPTQERKIG